MRNECWFVKCLEDDIGGQLPDSNGLARPAMCSRSSICDLIREKLHDYGISYEKASEPTSTSVSSVAISGSPLVRNFRVERVVGAKSQLGLVKFQPRPLKFSILSYISPCLPSFECFDFDPIRHSVIKSLVAL